MRATIRKIIQENIAVAPDLTMTQEDLNEILKGYIDAALWTEEERLNNDYRQSIGIPDDVENEDSEIYRIVQDFNNKAFESFIEDDLDENSKIKAYLDIKKFMSLCPDGAQEAIAENGLQKFGHDIWLTRNHHGAGFFDHSYDHEQELKDAADDLRGVELELGGDNKLHFH